MKNKSYLVFAAAVGILCVLSFGAESPVKDRQTALRPSLANPVLVGIEEAYVNIVFLYNDFGRDNLVPEDIKSKAEQRISRAGINITGAAVVRNGVATGMNAPELSVTIDRLDIVRPGFVFMVRTALAINSRLVGSLSTNTEIWTMGSTVDAASAENIPAAVTNLVTEQVDAFIAAYRSANPKEVRPEVVGDADSAANAVKKQSVVSDSQYQFVASKTVSVFHKKDCYIVKKIKAENLIGFATREEAVQGGRRPCEKCKP